MAEKSFDNSHSMIQKSETNYIYYKLRKSWKIDFCKYLEINNSFIFASAKNGRKVINGDEIANGGEQDEEDGGCVRGRISFAH